MRLIAHRAGHWCNGTPYDNAAIAAKAWRLAGGPVLHGAEQISEHECAHGIVRMAHAPDYGYALEIADRRHDASELWVSPDHDEVVERYLHWVRALR